MTKRELPKRIKLDREIRELQEWVPRQQARLRDSTLSFIDEALAANDPKKLMSAAGELGRLWNWYGIDGGMRVLRGDTEGWQEMSRALGCEMGEVAIFAYAYESGHNRNPVVLGNSVALMLAHSMAVGDHQAANWLAAHLEASIRTGVFGKWVSANAFEPFILQLHAKRLGRVIDFGGPTPSLGPYEAVFSAWSADDGSFALAIREACDHHLMSVNDTSNWTAEFAASIYRVWPAEIIAVERVRQRLGLSTPRVEHPLLATPLATPPGDVVAAYADETVQRLVAKAQSLWGADIKLWR
jgi:hypothetical protein